MFLPLWVLLACDCLGAVFFVEVVYNWVFTVLVSCVGISVLWFYYAESEECVCGRRAHGTANKAGTILSADVACSLPTLAARSPSPTSPAVRAMAWPA